MKLLYIGYITGPFGLKGEVKILSETNHKNDIFKVGNSLYIDNKKYIIESVKQNPNCEVIKFLGIDDIECIFIEGASLGKSVEELDASFLPVKP